MGGKGRNDDPDAREAMHKRRGSRPGARDAQGLTRRSMIKYSAAASLVAGLPPGLTDFLSRHDRPCSGKPPASERRTLFFNLSHEPDHESACYVVKIGQKLHTLEFTRAKRRGLHPAVARERRRNSFLASVPDEALSHVLDGVDVPADGVRIVPVLKDPDFQTGTWSLSSVYMQLPTSAVRSAYQQHLATHGVGQRLPSAKRLQYGLAAATTEQELVDETALIDTNDHATALVAVHPELLSVEPNSSGNILHNHIGTNGTTAALALRIQAAGAATPETTPGEHNATGWATLKPYLDSSGAPMKNTTGAHYKGLYHYDPVWHPTLVVPYAAQAMNSVVKGVKDDETLGADITNVASGSAAPGAVWQRRDGITSVEVPPGAVEDDDVQFVPISGSTPQAGYLVSGGASENSDGSVSLTLDFTNWYVRWLGVYVGFLDGETPIPVSQLPAGISTVPRLDTATEVFCGVIPPEFTLYAIPVQKSTLQVSLRFPIALATNIRVLASGLGHGSHTYPNTEATGVAMTSVFNLIVPGLMLGMGAAQFVDPMVKLVVMPTVTTIAIECTEASLDANPDNSLVSLLWRTIVNSLTGSGAVNLYFKTFGPKLAAYFGSAEIAAEAEDAVPFVGVILQAVAALATIATIDETGIEVLLSPWTYQAEYALKHTLTVNFTPGNNSTLPEAATACVVTALFDKGTAPHAQTVAVRGGEANLIVSFPDVPLGGNVTVTGSFYQVPSDPTLDQVLLGKGTTGLVENGTAQLTAAVEEFPFPISANTVYVHRRKTTLDAAGAHTWTTSAAPTTKAGDITCDGPGDLCAFRGITVREGTPQTPGYVGYVWQSNSVVAASCPTGQGELDYLATIKSDANPPTTYSISRCGLLAGARMAYSLLSQDSANFYLDSSSGLIRQVTLSGTPAFDPPSAQRAWGKLNFPSDALLLHPTGKLVSVSRSVHKLETHLPPDTPQPDADASVNLLAQVHSGQGSRPGRIDTPAAAAISADGVILVLEQGNTRIQALDVGGNPVPYFAKQRSPYFFDLTTVANANTELLDIAVEFTGFLYVLSYDQAAQTYRLDVFHSDQNGTTPISTTQGVNAARLTVDYFRNVYTLNYEVLRLPNGTVPAVAEPSVSLWTPEDA